MNIASFKLQGLLVVAAFISVLYLSSCGQQGNNSTNDAGSDSSKQAKALPPATSDSIVNLVEPQGGNENPVNTTQQQKMDPKNKMTNIEQKKESDPVKKITATQPVLPEKKTATNNPVVPSENKEVIVSKDPPVVQAKPVEVERPAPVVVPQHSQSDWVIPSKYINMTSSFPVDKESIELGKSLYGIHCKSCHGSKGNGDGSKASTLDTKVNSFHSTAFLSQKPGEVYYESIIGRKDMPRFEKKISDEEERWAVVYYIMHM